MPAPTSAIQSKGQFAAPLTRPKRPWLQGFQL